MATQRRRRACTGLALGCATFATTFAFAQAPVTGGYDALTNVYRTVTNFNIETVRGMAYAADGTYVFLNTHGSLLAFHRPGGTPLVPDDVHPTLNNPIALDMWYHHGDTYVAVLGGTSHALALHEFATGRVVATVQLPAETGDVVVDNERACAFVSCPGDNSVHQIDLVEALRNTPGVGPTPFVARFTVASQRPRFLALDVGKDGVDDNVVYVTPELSGNNTITSATEGLNEQLTFPFNQDPNNPLWLGPIPFAVGIEALSTHLGMNVRVVDLDNFVGITTGLPDEDLFRIDPRQTGGATQVVPAVPVLRGAGTVLAAHGRNPVNGRYWIVGTDALNGDLLRQSEPKLKGNFATNQLAIANTLGGASMPHPTVIVDLDQNPSGGAYQAAFSSASPYALEFDPQRRFVVIAGAAADRVRFVDNQGARRGDLELPDGSIPRDLMFDPTGTILFVYCWGTNDVLIYNATQLWAAFPGAPNNVIVNAGLRIDLGVDPTPERVQRGRELFYNAQNSAAARSSCNTCHPGGGTDILGWVIQDFPHDHKDLMVTQSLKGIEDTFPYHWRGERDLAQFNVAFEGLLGGQRLDESPGGELDDFIAFVFSMQPHANPRQSPKRELDATRSTALALFSRLSAPTGNPNPVQGQMDMDDPKTLFGTFSCADCHQKQHGTIGDFSPDDPFSGTKHATNGTLDTAHFRQLFHRTQDLVTLRVAGTDIEAIRGGYGLTHDGNHPSPFDFVADPINAFDLSTMRAVDLGAFVEQADQGVSPAVHRAWFLNDSSLPLVAGELTDILFAQVGQPFQSDHGVSVAGFGNHRDQQGGVHDLRWYYQPYAQLFYASDPTVVFPDGMVGAQSATALITEIMARRATMTLLGVAPANAIRWSQDRDDDGLSDALELSLGIDPLNPDSDGDLDEDGHEYWNPSPTGPTYNDPSQQATDTTPPSLVWWRLEHMTASTAKIVYALSEPSQVRFTATDLASNTSVIEERFDHTVWDTIVVQHLTPSKPALTVTPSSPAFPQTLGAVPTSYVLSLTLTDLAGNSNTVPIQLNPGQPIATGGQLVTQPYLGIPNPTGPAAFDRVIRDRRWTATTHPGTLFNAEITVGARYDTPDLAAAFAANPALLNGYSTPAEGQVIAAQVNIKDPTTGEWSAIPKANPAQPAVLGVVVAPGSVFDNVFSFGPQDSFGPYVISGESNGVGVATLSFSLNNPLPVGAVLELNFVGIYERDNAAVQAQGGLVPIPPATGTGTFPRNVFWGFSSLSYNMPATQESLRALLYP